MLGVGGFVFGFDYDFVGVGVFGVEDFFGEADEGLIAGYESYVEIGDGALAYIEARAGDGLPEDRRGDGLLCIWTLLGFVEGFAVEAIDVFKQDAGEFAVGADEVIGDAALVEEPVVLQDVDADIDVFFGGPVEAGEQQVPLGDVGQNEGADEPERHPMAGRVALPVSVALGEQAEADAFNGDEGEVPGEKAALTAENPVEGSPVGFAGRGWRHGRCGRGAGAGEQQAGGVGRREQGCNAAVVLSSLGEGSFDDGEGKVPHDWQIPNAEESRGEGKKGDGDGEGGFLRAGAFEELEGYEPGAEEAEKYAGDEDVENEKAGGNEGNHERPPAALVCGFGWLDSPGDADAAAVGDAQDVAFTAGEGLFDPRLAGADDALEVAAEVFFRRAAGQGIG